MYAAGAEVPASLTGLDLSHRGIKFPTMLSIFLDNMKQLIQFFGRRWATEEVQLELFSPRKTANGLRLASSRIWIWNRLVRS